MEHTQENMRAFKAELTAYLDQEDRKKAKPTISRRDFFAGMALQGLLSNIRGAKITYKMVVEESVSYADAMIEELGE